MASIYLRARVGAFPILSVWIAAFSADAAPVIFKCTYLDGSSGGSYSSSVNQLMIDAENNHLEFRAAETIGTSSEVKYSFRSDGSDRLVLSKVGDGYVAAGVRFGAPYAIKVDVKKSVTIWSYIDGLATEFSRYNCDQ